MQKHFHSLTCEKWADSKDLKISDKEVERFESAFKIFLNSDLSSLQNYCDLLLTGEVKWKCFKYPKKAFKHIPNFKPG